jgi:hypothetical protein
VSIGPAATFANAKDGGKHVFAPAKTQKSTVYLRRDHAGGAQNSLSCVPAAALHDPHVTRNLQLMLWDAALYSIMVGLGEQYLSAFAIALGFSATIAGWITTIPLLAGSTLQLISPWAVERLGSHRTWVVGCVLVQGLSFVPLVIAAVVGTLPAFIGVPGLPPGLPGMLGSPALCLPICAPDFWRGARGSAKPVCSWRFAQAGCCCNGANRQTRC